MVLDRRVIVIISFSVLFVLYIMIAFQGNISTPEEPPTIAKVPQKAVPRPTKKQNYKPNYDISETDLDKARKIDVLKDDVLIYLHIQKTSGASFGIKLVNGLVIGPEGNCCPGGIQHKSCTCLTSNGRIWLYSHQALGNNACGLHPDWTGLQVCLDAIFNAAGQPRRPRLKYHWLSMLRDPVARFTSEWQHCARGATWRAARLHCGGVDHRYTWPFCFGNDTWTGVTFEEFFSCKYNLAFNRMTRMLADLTQVNCYDHAGLSRKFVDETMLASAIEHLRSFAFFGLAEEQSKTQFLFEKTFGLKFNGLFEQKTGTHVERADRDLLSERDKERIAEANSLDVRLLEFAKELFYKRVEYFEKKFGYTVEDYFDHVRDSELIIIKPT